MTDGRLPHGRIHELSLETQSTNGVVYLTADGFDAAGGVAHGFSTRLGGVSEGIYASLNLGMNRGDDPDRVEENYRRFCAAIGADDGHSWSVPARCTGTRCVPSPPPTWASGWTAREPWRPTA